MADANRSTQIDRDDNPKDAPVATPQTGRKPGDAPKTEIPKVADTGPGKIYLIDRPNSAQANLVVGTLSIERTDPDYFALEAMNQVLGGGGAARLFLNLREDKGYTYGAGSGVSSAKYRGTFRANTEVRQDVTKGAMDELMKELKRIRDENIPVDDLVRACALHVDGRRLTGHRDRLLERA